jgi:hypothetical protein
MGVVLLIVAERRFTPHLRDSPLLQRRLARGLGLFYPESRSGEDHVIQIHLIRSRRMLKFHQLATALTGLICLGAVAASAQETGGVKITGSVHNTVRATNTVNYARGANAEAHMDIGSIKSGVHVQGNVNMNVEANDVANFADGPNKRSVTSIGSLHKGARVDGDTTVSVNRVTNVATDNGETSCVVIGSHGSVPGCDD